MDHGCADHLHENDQQDREQSTINDGKLAFHLDIDLTRYAGRMPL